MKETQLGDFAEVLLLLVAILEQDAYPLRITEEFKQQTGRGISVGAVHSTLERLEKKGFVSSKMGSATAERGGRRKRIFSITAIGKRTLKSSRDFKMSLWDQLPALATSKIN